MAVSTPRSLAGGMAASLRGYLAAAYPYQRFLYLVAAIFAVNAAVHAVVFVVDDRPWAGPASWRQPLAFSVAFVFVLSSLAWALGFLQRRQRLGWAVSGTLGVAALGTVSLIALQAWRATPAFFPPDRPFEQGVWTGMQIGIGFIVLPILIEIVWAMTALQAPPALQWAIRAGLLFMLAGLAMGGLMVAEGVRQDIDLGQVDSPVTFGEAGVVVFPHLLSLHGLFVLGALAWLLSFTALPERGRVGIVQVAIVGYLTLVTVSLTQALDGAAPFDLTGVRAVLFWVSVVLLAGVLVTTLTRLRPPRPQHD